MQLHIVTQFRENYGNKLNPYWKNKGGEDYLIDVSDIAESLNIRSDVEAVVVRVKDQIEYFNDSAEEFIVSWGLVEDDYKTEFEKSQLEYDGSIVFPAKRLSLENIGA